MATWKKILVDGDPGVHLGNSDLTASGSRQFTLSSGGYLKFKSSSNSDLLNLASNGVTIGGTSLVANHSILSSTNSLYFLNGITISGANSYHLFTSPRHEFAANTGASSAGDGSTIVMKRLTDNGISADGMNVGVIKFQAENSANANHEYARISVNTTDVSTGTEDAEINFNVHVSGSSQEALSLKPTASSDKLLYGIDIYGSSLRSWLTPALLGPWTRSDIDVPAGQTKTEYLYLGSSSGDGTYMNTQHMEEMRVMRNCYVTGVSFIVDVQVGFGGTGGVNMSFSLYKNGANQGTFGVFNDTTLQQGGETNIGGTHTVSSPYTSGVSFSAGDRLGLRMYMDNQYNYQASFRHAVAYLEITYA